MTNREKLEDLNCLSEESIQDILENLEMMRVGQIVSLQKFDDTLVLSNESSHHYIIQLGPNNFVWELKSFRQPKPIDDTVSY